MGQYCFAGWRLSLSSVVVVCNAAGKQAGRPPSAWAVGRPTLLHGGSLRLRPVRATHIVFTWSMLTMVDSLMTVVTSVACITLVTCVSPVNSHATRIITNSSSDADVINDVIGVSSMTSRRLLLVGYALRIHRHAVKSTLKVVLAIRRWRKSASVIGTWRPL